MLEHGLHDRHRLDHQTTFRNTIYISSSFASFASFASKLYLASFCPFALKLTVYRSLSTNA